jgi:hypothetical protein
VTTFSSLSAPASTTTVPSATTTTTASPSATVTESTDLADGRHPALIRSVDAAQRLIVVDIVQWFTGDAARRAAAEDGAPEPNDDYYVRNANPRLRTLAVAFEAPITVNVLGAEESGSATKDIPTTLDELAGNPGLKDALFWLTLRDGQVQRIAEQYLP